MRSIHFQYPFRHFPYKVETLPIPSASFQITPWYFKPVRGDKGLRNACRFFWNFRILSVNFHATVKANRWDVVHSRYEDVDVVLDHVMLPKIVAGVSTEDQRTPPSRAAADWQSDTCGSVEYVKSPSTKSILTFERPFMCNDRFASRINFSFGWKWIDYLVGDPTQFGSIGYASEFSTGPTWRMDNQNLTFPDCFEDTRGNFVTNGPQPSRWSVEINSDYWMY